MGLFGKPGNLIAVYLQHSEATSGFYSRHRSKGVLIAVKCDQFRYIHIGQAVSVGEAELRLGFDQGYSPRFRVFELKFCSWLRKIKRYGLRGVQGIVGEIFLDDVTSIAKADDEIRSRSEEH